MAGRAPTIARIRSGDFASPLPFRRRGLVPTTTQAPAVLCYPAQAPEGLETAP
jgi:hypothetical protein